MTKGILLYAFDNSQTKYGKIADLCAILVKRFMNKPSTVVIDRNTTVDHTLFDHVIEVETTDWVNNPWRNAQRHGYYNHSPYDQTIVMDTDYLVFNNRLNCLFDYTDDLLLSNQAVTPEGYPVNPDEQRLTDTGIDMTWATLFYFRKGRVSEAFFKLTDYVREHYAYLAPLFGVDPKRFRNDFVFSIARHIWVQQETVSLSENPFTLYTAYRDVSIIECDDRGVVLTNPIDKTQTDMRGLNVHVLNKSTILDHYDRIRLRFE